MMSAEEYDEVDITLTNIVSLEVPVGIVGRLGSCVERSSLDNGGSESSDDESRCEHCIVDFDCCFCWSECVVVFRTTE
jgi:hypothetical protein